MVDARSQQRTRVNSPSACGHNAMLTTAKLYHVLGWLGHR
jgi:hypothetical protein